MWTGFYTFSYRNHFSVGYLGGVLQKFRAPSKGFGVDVSRFRVDMTIGAYICTYVSINWGVLTAGALVITADL